MAQTCENCGEEIRMTANKHRGKDGLFCSYECSIVSRLAKFPDTKAKKTILSILTVPQFADLVNSQKFNKADEDLIKTMYVDALMKDGGYGSTLRAT